MLSITDYKGAKIGQIIEGTLAAGQMRGLTAVGVRFYVIETDGEIGIKTNNSTKNTFTARQGLFADPSALYERIEIYNDTGADVTFRVFYGFGDFVDGTSDVTGSVEVSALPATAASAAKQDAQTALLTTIEQNTDATETAAESIDAKTPALSAGRVPVESVGLAPTAHFADSAASTNATSVKAAAGTLFSVFVSNINAAIRYLKIYNLAVAPTVGVDVPVLTVPIPATGSANINLGALGLRFSVGIAFALTVEGTNAGATGVAANEIKTALSYV